MRAFNPYLPSWEHLPDAEPHVFGDRIYIYGSHDAFGASTYSTADHVCWSAPVDDLSQWRYEGVIFRKQDDPRNEPNTDPAREFAYKGLIYASDVCQGPDGRFYLYYALAPFGLKDGDLLGVAVCDEPAGHYRFLGNVTLPDGRYLSGKCGHGFVFDPAVYREGSRTWLCYGYGIDHISKRLPGAHLGAWVMELAPDMLTGISAPVHMVPGKLNSQGTSFEEHPFLEASSMRKIRGNYYFIYSSLAGHDLCWTPLESPATPPTRFGGVLHSNCDYGLYDSDNLADAPYWPGNNHGSLIELDGHIYVFGHRHTGGVPNLRQATMEEIELRADGSFAQAELTSLGPSRQSIRARDLLPAHVCCHLRPRQGVRMYSTSNTRTPDEPYVGYEGVASCLTASVSYVANLCDGAEFGYKYLAFDGAEKSLLLELRGSFEGTISAHLGSVPAPPIAQIKVVPHALWQVVTTPVELAGNASLKACDLGRAALYFTVAGSGSLDVLSIRFE